MSKYATKEEMEKIQALRDRQDNHAFRMGVLHLEYEGQAELITNAVNLVKDEQRAHGEAILERHGLSQDRLDYKIDDDTGEIMILDAGAWKSVD